MNWSSDFISAVSILHTNTLKTQERIHIVDVFVLLWHREALVMGQGSILLGAA